MQVKWVFFHWKKFIRNPRKGGMVGIDKVVFENMTPKGMDEMSANLQVVHNVISLVCNAWS